MLKTLLSALLLTSLLTSVVAAESKPVKYAFNFEVRQKELSNFDPDLTVYVDEIGIKNLITLYQRTFGPLSDFYTEIKFLGAAEYEQILAAPAWSKAIYTSSGIYLRVDSQNIDQAALTKTLAHELSHVMIDKLTNYNAPAWFDEGLSIFFAEQPDKRSLEFLLDGLDLREQSLQSLNKSYVHLAGNQVKAAYAKSYLATKTLLEDYKIEQIRSFVGGLRDRGHQQAFIEAFNISIEEFDQQLIAKSDKQTLTSGLLIPD